MIGSMINSAQFNTGGINGNTLVSDVTTTLKVIYNQSGITLNWTSVTPVVGYFLQVSLYADFRTTFVNTTVGVSQYSFTDSQPSGQKRFWRWAPTLNGIDRSEPWSEVGSYWLDTALSAELELNRNEWAFADPEDMLDQYELDLFPTSLIVKRNLYRSQERNRLGELLSEFLTVKDLVTLNFQGAQYMEMAQLAELERFHNSKRTFFLAAFKDGAWFRPMPHVWLVECQQDPTFNMIAAGRPDLLSGTISFEEV
jgi:hypothetical protein